MSINFPPTGSSGRAGTNMNRMDGRSEEIIHVDATPSRLCTILDRLKSLNHTLNCRSDDIRSRLDLIVGIIPHDPNPEVKEAPNNWLDEIESELDRNMRLLDALADEVHRLNNL